MFISIAYYLRNPGESYMASSLSSAFESSIMKLRNRNLDSVTWITDIYSMHALNTPLMIISYCFTSTRGLVGKNEIMLNR